jgi:hypothetical protein
MVETERIGGWSVSYLYCFFILTSYPLAYLALVSFVER